MPTYVCSTLEGQLDVGQKAKIAAEITRIHNAVTHAPAYFAQIIFEEIAGDNYFMGGAPLKHQQVFVHGHIRGGRTPQDKKRLIEEIGQAVGAAARVPMTSVWVYISELVPSQMMEYGHILPEPGSEEAWSRSLPAADRELMLQVGA